MTDRQALKHPVLMCWVCCGQVEWVGQPIGLIVAESRALATRAAALVKVSRGIHRSPVGLLGTLKAAT